MLEIALLLGGFLAVAFAFGYRHKAHAEYVKKCDEVAALRRDLAQLQAEKQSLDAELASIQRERDALRRLDRA